MNQNKNENNPSYNLNGKNSFKSDRDQQNFSGHKFSEYNPLDGTSNCDSYLRFAGWLKNLSILSLPFYVLKNLIST